MNHFNTGALDALEAKIKRIREGDPTPLLERWEMVIAADNRRGVLAGLDRHDLPMVPCMYRDSGGGAFGPGSKGPARDGAFHPGHHAWGPYAAGFDGNLSRSQYMRLTGPPLAPRYDQSRVIKSLETGHGHDPSTGQWFAVGAWADVVSREGVKFLPYHFEGAGHLPKRDMRGVRAEGRRDARDLMLRWIKSLLKG